MPPALLRSIHIDLEVIVRQSLFPFKHDHIGNTIKSQGAAREMHTRQKHHACFFIFFLAESNLTDTNRSQTPEIVDQRL